MIHEARMAIRAIFNVLADFYLEEWVAYGPGAASTSSFHGFDVLL